VTRFLDTNILLYSISNNPAEAGKRARAIALLDADDNALSVQVLQEFYVQATRPTRPDALPQDIAAGLIRTWLRFKVQENTVPLMLDALRIKGRYGISYWDAGRCRRRPRARLSRVGLRGHGRRLRLRGNDGYQSVQMTGPKA